MAALDGTGTIPPDMNALRSSWRSFMEWVRSSGYGPVVVVAGIVAVVVGGWIVLSIAVALFPPLGELVDALVSLGQD